MNQFNSQFINLSFDRELKTPSFDGGGLNRPPSLILFMKTIENVIRLCIVLIFFFWSGSFEDTGIFHVFIYLSICGSI